MIFATDRYGMKLLLISSSRTDRLTSTDHPLKALIESSFTRVLARIESSDGCSRLLSLDLPESSRSEDKALQRGGGVED